MTKLSDAQINRRVCKKLGLGLSSYARIITQDDATVLLDDNKTLVDYCNNWSDAGPIIVEHKICLIPEIGDGTWWAMYQPVIQIDWRVDADNKTIENDTNPLRAAMIVFLEMQ